MAEYKSALAETSTGAISDSVQLPNFERNTVHLQTAEAVGQATNNIRKITADATKLAGDYFKRQRALADSDGIGRGNIEVVKMLGGLTPDELSNTGFVNEKIDGVLGGLDLSSEAQKKLRLSAYKKYSSILSSGIAQQNNALKKIGKDSLMLTSNKLGDVLDVSRQEHLEHGINEIRKMSNHMLKMYDPITRSLIEGKAIQEFKETSFVKNIVGSDSIKTERLLNSDVGKELMNNPDVSKRIEKQIRFEGASILRQDNISSSLAKNKIDVLFDGLSTQDNKTALSALDKFYEETIRPSSTQIKDYYSHVLRSHGLDAESQEYIASAFQAGINGTPVPILVETYRNSSKAISSALRGYSAFEKGTAPHKNKINSLSRLALATPMFISSVSEEKEYSPLKDTRAMLMSILRDRYGGNVGQFAVDYEEKILPEVVAWQERERKKKEEEVLAERRESMETGPIAIGIKKIRSFYSVDGQVMSRARIDVNKMK